MRYKIHMRLVDAQQAYFAARRPRKDSPHTTDAYRRDLAGITALLVDEIGGDADMLVVEDLTAQSLRAVFGAFADTHAKSSVLRAWSTWNQFLTFCVADGLLPATRWGGGPPEDPSPVPQAAAGRGHAGAAARGGGARGSQGPGPVAGAGRAGIALGLLAGLRSAEMRTLTAIRWSAVRVRCGCTSTARAAGTGRSRWSRRWRSDRRRTWRRAGRGSRTSGSAAALPLLRDRRVGAIGRGALEYLVKSCYRGRGCTTGCRSGANLHALRHTFATRLAEDGATASEIMALLGHASLATSQNYIEATGREQRAAVASNRTYRALEDVETPPSAPTPDVTGSREESP